MTSKANLGPDVEETIAMLVATGRYSSESDVLAAGVRLLEQRERKREELEALIEQGLDDLEAGRTFPADDVFKEVKAKFRRTPVE